MKKLLFALGFLLALSAPAKAGVPCSVPFNLTNGTVADASQVMANYNAILSCLSVSTAHSGANTDITSLGALSTPITPAQGGAVSLCGALGYKVVNDVTFPNSSLDITFLQAIVTNASNAIQFAPATSLVLNFSTNGVDGLDTGVLAASTPYYIWLIGNGTAIHSLASLSSTAPTMPGGYTFSCRLSGVPTTTGPALYQILTLGFLTVITQSTAGTPFQVTAGAAVGNCSTTTFVAQTFLLVPVTATQLQGFIAGIGATTIAVARALTGGQYANYTAVGAAAGFELFMFFNGLMPAPQTIYWCSSAAGNALIVNGWIDNTNAH